MNDHIYQIAHPLGSTAPEAEKLPVFLVQESNFLIAQDLIGSLQALEACRAIHITDPNEIILAASSEQSLSAAFLEMHYEDVLGMNLDKVLNELGALIILTVGPAEEDKVRSAGWGLLARPFTEEMIHEELKAANA